MKYKTKHNLIVALFIIGGVLTGIGIVFVTVQHLWITVCLILCVVSILALDRKEGEE